MDPRSPYLHQNNRYASHQSQSQPQLQSQPRPHNNFHNLHASHHSGLPSSSSLPLRPPPPPSPTQFHLSPSQPQYNPQNPSFGYNSNNINYNHHHRSHPEVSNFTQSPRVLHQKPFDDDLSRRLQDNRENRESSRVLPDRWPPERPYSTSNLNPDPYRRQFGNQAMSPMKIRHGGGVEGSSRFVEERNNVNVVRQGDEFLLRRGGGGDDNYHHRRVQFGSNSERSSRDFRTVSNQMNHGSSYENSRGSPYDDGVSESQRWGRDREVSADLRDSFIDKGNHEGGAPERIQMSAKRENYRSREGNVELERHTGKGSREGSFEYNRTPRKQLQKKSALLRLQKPNYRNREEERGQYYFDDSKSTSFRVKEQNLYSDRGMEEQVREGSPVELDVSFKSNSLVAKAILTPSSSSAAVSDSDSTPRSAKVRKVLFLNKDSSSSSLIRYSEQNEKLDNALSVANKASSSDTGLNQSKEEGTASGIGNLRNAISVPASSGTKVSYGKSKMESATKAMVSKKDGINVASAKTSSVKVAKKKKIVKRVVKKVVHPNLSSSSSLPIKKYDETVIPDSIDHGLPDSSEPEKDAAIASASTVNSQLCSNEILLMPQNDKVEEICKAAAPENGADADSHSLCVPIIKRKRSHITFRIGSSSREATQNNDDKLNPNSADCMHAISNADEDNKLPKETSSSDVDETGDVDKQQYKHDDSLLLENNEVSRSPDMLLPSKCNVDIGLSSLEKIEILQCQPSSYNMVLGYGTDHGSINSRKRVTVSEYGVMDADCKEHCMDQDSPPVEDGSLDEISNASSIGNSKMFKQPNSGDTEIQKVATHPICSNEGARTMSGSDNGHSLSEEIISFSHGVTNGKKPSPERVSMSIDDDSARESLNFMVSTGVREEDTSNSQMSEKNVETSQVKLLKTEVNGSHLDPVNRVRPACWVDTTLRLSFKECGSLSLDTAVQPCRDVGRVFPLESSIDVPEDFIAPPKQKQRKLSGSQLKLSCTMTPNVKEIPINSDISVSSAQAPSCSDDSSTGSEAEAREAAMDPLSISVFPLSANNIASLANCSGGECHRTVASIRDVSDNDSVHLCSTTEELAVPKVQSLYPPGLEAGQIADVTESAEGGKMDVDAADGKTIIDSGTGLCEIQSSKSDERLQAAEMENESCHHVKNDLSSVSKYLSPPRDDNGVPVPNSGIEVLGLVTDTLSDTDYIEILPKVPSTLDSQLLIERVCRDDEILGKVSSQGGSNTFPLISDSLNADVAINSNHALENANLFSGKTGNLPPMGIKNSSQTLNATSGETYWRMDQPAKVSRILGSSGLATSKNAASSTHLSKPRTWHRADKVPASAPPENKAVSTTVPKQRQLSRNVSKSQSTSYIRKGNSLVRKPTVGAAQSQGSHSSNSSIWLNSLGTDEVKKTTGLDNISLAAEPPNFGRKMVNVSFETLRTPPLPAGNKTPNHNSGSLGDRMASPAAEPVNNFAAETSGLVNVAESNGVPTSSEDAKVSENPTKEIGQINNFDSHNEVNDGNMVSSNANRITYVKRKSNQLIAASNSHLSINDSIDTSAAPSDRYYKRRKNQLIRTSLESQAEQMASFPAGIINSDEQALHKSASSKSFTKRQLRKVVTKMCKPSKFSLVWTLHSSQLSNGNGTLVHRQKVLPHLFPWKRATYLRKPVPNVAASLISSSSSPMRKLQLLRKRDTLYTRSKHGFSLRKSKVLSVGGSSLKWSKSIERQSKKANEEATLAVAEAERKKREQSGASHFVSGNKNSSSRKAVHNVKLHTGGQIFRIGSIRYKMDSSRRTLQRVSDDDSSYPSARPTEKDAKISYVPRRLVIGKDEYVWIGNGNQLVRDPKRRTRILASEKVRWSLHTARSRLARRRKYCQFFTRFGKCNKDDGKCPYIHDSSKIAVCTKFLKGLCFNADCKLTHKVIPERMPDCSYFLQGICSNKNCPYRHVHVNPNASTCEGFLRGYCADGDECRKKHSYVCPTYEATGSCPQGSKCKLHHPQDRRKGKKSKQSREKKNGQGRYFGSMHKNVSEPGTRVSGGQDNIKMEIEESIGEFISLDYNDEGGESSNRVDEEMYISDSDPLDLQLVDLDDLIKPIRIMKMGDEMKNY